MSENMENKDTVVNQEPLTEAPISEDVKTQEPEVKPTEEVKPKAQAGDKTDPNLLLKSLQGEREKRRLLEEKLETLQGEREKRRLLEEELETLKSSALSEDEVFSDEGKALKKQITALTEKINSIEEDKNLQAVYSQYPVLREKSEDFDTFRAEYPRTKLGNVAKLYLAENGLLEPTRKGLEKTTGGPRIPMTSGMTADDVKKLRETNFKKYQDMLSKGLIKIAE